MFFRGDINSEHTSVCSSVPKFQGKSNKHGVQARKFLIITASFAGDIQILNTGGSLWGALLPVFLAWHLCNTIGTTSYGIGVGHFMLPRSTRLTLLSSQT